MMSHSTSLKKQRSYLCQFFNEFSFLKLLFVFFFIALISIDAKGQSQSTGDTEYWFVAPDASQLNSDNPVFLLIATGDQAATVTATMGGTTLFTQTIGANSYYKFTFPTWTGATGGPENAYNSSGVVTYKGIHITSTARVIAYYQQDGSSAKEIFTFKGKNALGRKFYLPFQQTYTRGSYYQALAYQQIQIVATENNTVVTVEPPARANAKIYDNSNNTIITSTSTIASRTRTLNKGETLLWRSSTSYNASNRDTISLTGTKIESTKPIAVTLFDDCVFSNAATDPIGDQIVPVDKVGKDYIVIKGFTSSTHNATDHIGVLATTNGTTVSLNGTAMITLNEGQYWEYNIGFGNVAPGSFHVSANNPIYCMHQSGGLDELGGALVPSITSISARKTAFMQGSMEQNYIFLLFKSTSATGFTMNGNPITITPVATGYLNWQYARYQLPASQNNQFVKVENSLGSFGLGYFMNNINPTVAAVYGYLSNFGYAGFSDTIKTCGYDYLLDGPDEAESYSWVLPDSTIVPDSTSLTATQSGLYILNTVQDQLNVSDTTYLILQNFKHILDYTHPVCMRDTAEFSIQLNPQDDSLNIYRVRYEWTFTGANTSSVTHIGRSDSLEVVENIRWNTAGTKQVKLKITNLDLLCDTTINISYIVNPLPVLTSPGNKTFCAGTNTQPITFSGNTNVFASDSTYWYNSNPAIGLPASGRGNIPSFLAAAGNATITVTPISNQGCVGQTITFTITVKIVNIQNLNLDTIRVCAGDTINSIPLDNSAYNVTYAWSNNNTAIGLSVSGTVSIPEFISTNTSLQPDTAFIEVIPTSADGCLMATDTLLIIVFPTPRIAVDLFNIPVCAGDTVWSIKFSNLPSSAIQYSWENSETGIGLAATGVGDSIPFFIPSNAGNSPLIATIKVTPSINGCVGVAKEFNITVNPVPTINEALANLQYCANQVMPDIEFTSAVANTTFAWTSSNTNFGLPQSGNGNIPSVNLPSASTDSIKTTITVTPTANGCVGQAKTFDIYVLPAMKDTVNSTICDGQTYYLGGQAITEAGTYYATINSNTSCDTLRTLILNVASTIAVEDIPLSRICADDPNFTISFLESNNPDKLKPTNYSVTFDSKAILAGFSDFTGTFSGSDLDILVTMPVGGIYPDRYSAQVELSDNGGCDIISRNFNLEILYPDSIMDQKWGDVVTLVNSTYNGGFEFVAYQWYKNGIIMPGETKSYVYIGLYGETFRDGDEYSVNITRPDGSTLFTCPLITHEDFTTISIAPTLVQLGGIIQVKLQKSATAKFWNQMGLLINTQHVSEYSNTLKAPSMNGVFILEITEDETGTRRTFNIIVQ